jgi:glycosyltransferase involved in cell wall biosynthesis
VRIVIDVSPLSDARPRTGIGNYLRGMLSGLAPAARRAGHEVIAFAPTGPRGRGRIEAALAEIPVELKLVTLPRAHAWRTAWSRLGAPAVERVVGPLDVFHFSDWMYPPQRGGLRTTTIHDLVPLRFPEWTTVQTRRMHAAKYRETASTCGLVFANSAFTAREVEQVLGVPRSRIRVAYPGVDPRFSPEGPREDLGKPYVLTVGTLEPRKNLGLVLDAFRLLRGARRDMQLVLAGAAGWGDSPPLAADGVHWKGFVTDDELGRLYRGASAFVYASRFEGFGIPVAEALASGTPVVCSAHESLDEACGGAALRADPENAEALAHGIEEALEGNGERVARGIAHASSFTWQACGAAFLAGFSRAGD